MGSGKSTVGSLVARRLGWPFLDLDDVIAERARRPVSVIFEKEGESGFRRRETEALQVVSRDAGAAVVATGGGALAREENLRCALQRGTVVYLRAPAEVLAQRLEAAATERPLLQDAAGQPLAGAALTARIEELLARRRPFYERAHVTVDAAARTPEEAAATVVRRCTTDAA